LLLIDQLRHAYHTTLRLRESGRPVVCNLLEGNRKQAPALLDGLAYGDHSTPELRATCAAWRDQVRPGAAPASQDPPQVVGSGRPSLARSDAGPPGTGLRAANILAHQLAGTRAQRQVLLKNHATHS
jgi:hypothetical protein